MVKNLVIVESPTKAKTISKFLGKNYRVMASIGHLRDLPKSRMGVDIENDFEPQYINVRGKAKTINEIKKVAKESEKVYLASDPDREGEAIAWHLAYLLDLDLGDKNRVVFPEITKETVKNAIKNPRKIDLSLVDAQQARRVMDRVVGYELSPILWKKVKSGLSAGRVQSVALKIIVDRENEIRNFEAQEYWTLNVYAKKDKINFESRYFGTFDGAKIKSKKILSEKDADDIIESLDPNAYRIIDKASKKISRRAYPPFTTSTLQQEASKRLNFSTSKTMSLAQQLYEGIYIGDEGSVGLISYMRTDSTRLSSQIIGEALSYIKDNFGDEYASKGFSYDKKRIGSQDAHEAVRVSSIYRTPEKLEKYLTKEQFKLYKLIWERTLASQMNPADFLSTRYDIENKGNIFKASGSINLFDGFSKVWKISDNTIILPDMEVGYTFAQDKLEKSQHFTKPKPRYSEATLVKKLEENGIGRPSTYSSIIKSIFSRNYIVIENKQLIPTDLGFTVTELLLEYFNTVIDEEFTARMENELDKIEDKKLNWKNLMKDFYSSFKKDLESAKESDKAFEIKKETTGEKCPECGGDLLYKDGRNGKFIGCSNFPTCTFTKAIVKSTGVKCTKCGGNIIEKISKRGKVFYGCSNYPSCDWASWDKPTGEKCPECGSLMVHRKNRRVDEIVCSNEDCPSNK